MHFYSLQISTWEFLGKLYPLSYLLDITYTTALLNSCNQT